MHPFLHYLTFSYLYIGALIALEVSAVSFVGSIVLGVLVAQARASRILPLRWISGAFVWVFRGTPILLQLLILFDGLPSIGVTLSPIWAAVIGFSLNGGAFLGEVIRGGISSTWQLTSVPRLATFERPKRNGFVKVVADPERRVVTGAVAVGPEAGEWLQQLTLAIRAETPIEVLLDVIQPYPTFSEGVFLALRGLDLDL